MPKFALVLIGGGLGALTRYGFGLLTAQWGGDRFPMGTLLVNLMGCFLIGLIFSLGQERSLLSPTTRLFLMTGFLGGLTTFSSYALESANLFRGGLPMNALLNILTNNLLGFLLLILGLWLGRVLGGGVA